MKRYKRLYIVSLILIAVVLTSVYFSYAFFANKNEQHGKLNVVVGDLKYKLESNDLVNGSITVPAGETKEITLTLTSLNSISSKYEIYYNLTSSNNVEVGYLNVPASGTIGANEVIEIVVLIKNKGSSSTTVTFGLERGLVNNQIVLTDGNSLSETSLCDYNIGYVWNFNYTGGEQIFTVPVNCSGTYKIETWGASGGYAYDSTRSTGGGGYGGYSVGVLKIFENRKLYLTVGGSGESNCQTKNCAGGYNGGSASSKWANEDGSGLYTGGGGGATHIATKSGLLYTLENYKSYVLIVSGGGGGADYYPGWGQYASGGSAGGYIGNFGQSGGTSTYISNSGGTQSSGSAFGRAITTYLSDSTGGSGGGYYGGISATQHGTGAGGSGYIGNSLLTDKAMYCYNCQTSNEVNTKTISTTCHSNNPTANCAKEGNGYARITYISSEIDTPEVGDSWDFAYTGGVQSFQPQVSGTYKIETWGAQGATDSTTYHGGYGAYASGDISLSTSQSIYLYVGGAGKNINTSTQTGSVKGYPNGGSVTVPVTNSNNINYSSGGGSTHIAFVDKLIKDTTPSNLLIVASGGGGSCNWWNKGDNGGNGGGIVGSTTTINYSNSGVANNNPTGGTQAAGGNGGGNLDGHAANAWMNGTYGVGGGTETGTNISGSGGGGYYGGGGSWGGSGAGGSSYIGNTLLFNKAMYCYSCTESNDVSTKTISTTCHSSNPTVNCAKEGNGYAKITLVSID